MQNEENISYSQLKNELRVSLEQNHDLEKENENLKQELLHLKTKIATACPQIDDQVSLLCKKSLSSRISNSSSYEKLMFPSNNAEKSSAVHNSISKPKSEEWPTTTKERPRRVPRPPPRPNYCPSIPNLSGKEALFPPPPPPPPPLPLRSRGMLSNAVRRMPEVVELYRTLTRKNGKPNTITSITGIPASTNSREMIGEIEKRSSYLLSVKSDVRNQGEFIDFLSREVENAAYREISEVENFVKWLDEELSHLVDERAVLKHFPQWPEQKADAMREAAFNYRDLKNLAFEISSFQDDINQTSPSVFKLIQTLQEKLEHSIHNLEKLRDSTSKRYRDFKIPCQWMHNSGIIMQLKLGSLNLAKAYMGRVVTALQSDLLSEEQEMLLQGVRFAFRVHQFVGGFDEESRQGFQELQKLASRSCTLLNSKKNDPSYTG